MLAVGTPIRLFSSSFSFATTSFLMSDDQPSNIFPQLPRGEPSLDWFAGDPAAPECPAQTLSGLNSAIRVESSGDNYLVTLVMPPDYSSLDGSLLVHGNVIRWRTASDSRARLELWLSSQPGYPTVGAAVGSSQVFLSECRVLLRQHTVWIVQFGVREYDDEYFFVAGYSPLGPHLVIHALGATSVKEQQALQFAALATMQVESPH